MMSLIPLVHLWAALNLQKEIWKYADSESPVWQFNTTVTLSSSKWIWHIIAPLD